MHIRDNGHGFVEVTSNGETYVFPSPVISLEQSAVAKICGGRLYYDNLNNSKMVAQLIAAYPCLNFVPTEKQSGFFNR